MMERIDKNGDRRLTWEEIYAADLARLTAEFGPDLDKFGPDLDRLPAYSDRMEELSGRESENEAEIKELKRNGFEANRNEL